MGLCQSTKNAPEDTRDNDSVSQLQRKNSARRQSRRRRSLTERRLIAALQKRRDDMRKANEELTFTKVLLKFDSIRQVIKHVKEVFNEMDKENKGQLNLDDLEAAMAILHGEMSREDVADLFEISDLAHDHQLTLKEFLVALAIGYVIGAIPALRYSPPKKVRKELPPVRRSSKEGPAAVAAPETSSGEGASDESASNAVADGKDEEAGADEKKGQGESAKESETRAPPPKRAVRRTASHLMGYEGEISEMMHLIVGAYLLFDPMGKGFIKQADVERLIEEEGHHEGAGTNMLSQERWEEMDWDHDGTIDFEEFVFAFSKWVDMGDDDFEDDQFDTYG